MVRLFDNHQMFLIVFETKRGLCTGVVDDLMGDEVVEDMFESR